MAHGVIRARYRNHPYRPEFMAPGCVYKFTIDMTPISFLLKSGHQLILEISSSNFPHFARNLNTGADLGFGEESVIAEQVIYHDAIHPSHVILPIIPTEKEHFSVEY